MATIRGQKLGLAPQMPSELIEILQQLPKNSVEHLAYRFSGRKSGRSAIRIIELVGELGQDGIYELRDILRGGQPRQAASTVGLLSRLDVAMLLEFLPSRMPELNRFYQDVVVREIAYGLRTGPWPHSR